MIAVAVRRHFDAPLINQTAELTPLEKRRETVTQSFSLLRSFIPGIGRFFLPITVGVLVQLVFVVLMSLWIEPMWQKVAPLIASISATLPTMTPEPQEAKNAWVMGLSMANNTVLVDFSMSVVGAMISYAVFTVLTQLWPVFTVAYEFNPLKAYGRSATQFFRDPFRLIFFALLMGLNGLLHFLVLTMADAQPFQVVASLLVLLFSVFLQILPFVYAFQKLGLPATSVETVLQAVSVDSASGNDAEPPRQ